MNKDRNEPPALDWTGERYVPEVQGDIRLEHVHRYLIARELTRNRRVLDIACGEGYGSSMLASAAAEVVGVDIAPEVIAHAALRYPLPNLRFEQGALEAIPLADQSVDAVVSFETIEHIDDPERGLDEMCRVLRLGGLLIISTPDRREYTDVLGNRNAYHRRELDRGEFEALLRARFRHVIVGGQRIRAGSIVGPLDSSTPSRFVTFPSPDEDSEAVDGLGAPVYLLALASNETLPELPVGFVDGGPFAWSSDLDQVLAQVQAQCAAEIGRRLGTPVDVERAAVDAIRAEFTRQAERVSEMVSRLAAWEPVVAEAERVHQRLQALTEELQAANSRLTEASAELASSRATAKAHAVAAHELEQTVRRLETDLARLQGPGGVVPALQGHVAHLRAQLDLYERSHSWRLTAPFRSARRHLSRARHQMRTGVRKALSIGRSLRAVRKPAPPSESRVFLPQSEQSASGFVPLRRTTPVETRINLIAFYLPQFHPIPENDEWWGKGFTEWTNVVRGRPQFAEHYQPHLPGELGFYDLRVVEVQRRQIELARLHGLYGFCYHHYWFAGRRLLRRPLDQLLAHPELDFPFCVCWANENWTRAWDGLDKELLIAQQHSAEDDLAFIRDLEPALRDPRYIKINGRPLLIVYRPALLPSASATAARWRTYCREAGIGELFLAATHAFDRRDPREFGFDAALEFAPNNMAGAASVPDVTHLNPQFSGVLYDYRELVALNRDRPAPEGYPLFRCVTPMWDNEARRPGRGAVFVHSSPGLYRDWLESACRWTERHFGPDRSFVFVNAWNEWAEGSHLEPDRRFGYAYLEATAEALQRFPRRTNRQSVVCVSHDAHFHGAQLIALNLVRTLSTRLNYQVETILCGSGELTAEFQAAGRVHDFSPSELTRADRLAVLQRLFDDGVRVAICNTSVVGEVVELLKLVGFSVISLVHELPRLIEAYGLDSSIRQIAEHADKVVFPAHVVRDRFRELTNLPESRCVIQPQGLFAPNAFFGRREAARRELRARLGLGPDTRIVLAVGYADHRKGIDLFVDVGSRVARSRTRDVKFVWVGGHEPSAFERACAIADQAGLRDRFLFPGPVRNSDLFFAGADAYLMTSREDPFPSVVLEALDAGLPVIGFEGAGGFNELLQRGCGVLVPYCDTAAMAVALARMLTVPAEAEQLVRTGRRLLERDFSYVNYARSLAELVTAPRLKVSVIVPNFNYARYLPSRLASIVGQTYAPYEVIFLDDCSKDDSVERAEEILHASKLSYRIVANETNQGTYRQWLRGLRDATGDLIWIAEADDECSPRFLEKLVPSFEDPDVMLAYCQSRQIDAEGRTIAPDYLEYTADISRTKWRSDYVRGGLDEIRDTLVVKNTIPNASAVVMRRGDLSSIEERLLRLRNVGDWLLYVHLLTLGKVAFVSEALNSHRRHTGSVTIGRGGLNLMRETLLVQQYVLDRYGETPEAAAKRTASLQATYEYLGLHVDGPPSYRDHDALKVLEWAATA